MSVFNCTLAVVIFQWFIIFYICLRGYISKHSFLVSYLDFPVVRVTFTDFKNVFQQMLLKDQIELFLLGKLHTSIVIRCLTVSSSIYFIKSCNNATVIYLVLSFMFMFLLLYCSLYRIFHKR